MKRIASRALIYRFSSDMDGVEECLPGEECVFETLDCFGGQLKGEGDDFSSIDFSRVNPATGPVTVRGARRGQLLRVEILDIRCFSPGIVATHPGIGVLRSGIPDYRFAMVSVGEGKCSLGDVSFPLQPMIGVMGVAPEEGSIPTTTPGAHGGNMDTREICPGNVVYLPVFQEGALLALGDVHAAMGDGEICGTGVEVSAEVRVRVDLLKNRWGLKSPLVEDKEYVIFIHSASNLERAFEEATWECSKFIQKALNWDFTRTYFLMSTTCHFRVSQLVDPLLTVKICLPREIFPVELL